MNLKASIDVAFGASSTKLSGHVGVAKALEERFTPVRVSGTSGGAIVAAAWAVLGADLCWDQIKAQKFSKYAGFSILSALRGTFWGYISNGKALFKDLKSILGDRTFSSPDLQYDLYITASNMTDGELVIYSKETSPDLELAVAVYRSACMPGIFKPMDDGERKIRDGAIYKDLPIDIWPDYIRPRVGHAFINEWKPKTSDYRFWNGLLEHQLVLARAIDDNFDDSVQTAISRQDVHILISGSQGLTNLSFDIPEAKKQKLFDVGYSTALEHSNGMLYDQGSTA